MFCKKCGNEMPDYAERCDKCGTKVDGGGVRQGFNKLLFIPIGAGAAAVIVLAAALIFALRPKDELVQPSDSGAQTTTSGESRSSAVIDSIPEAPPASTNGSSSAESRPREEEVIVPDAVSFSVNGDEIPVFESCCVGNAVGSDFEYTAVLWGENEEYVAAAMINVPESLIEVGTAYAGLYENEDGEPLAAVLLLYDIEYAETVTGMTGSGITEQVIKIGNYSSLNFISLSAAGILSGGDGSAKMPFSVSGRFDYLSNYDMINTVLNNFYDAVNSTLDQDIDEPEPVEEVIIAGESYPTDIDYLYLSGKNITNADIENLKYFTNLKNLQLADNSNLTDISVLSNLTQLEELWIQNTGISDISPLSGCKNLKALGIKYTKVKDLSVLSGFTKLEKFIATDCNISDISPVANCPQMREIWLSNNSITDFSPLVRLNNLETVGLDNCCNMTWDILKTLYGLNFSKTLKLNGNGITEEMANTLSENLYSPDGKGEWWY